jgi:spore germination protein YaaH
VSSSKVIIGIPFYTRVWQEDGNNALSSKTYGMSSINDIISNKGLTKNWLSDLGVNYCEYEDNGSTYKMWIEDAQSIEEKMKLINKSNAAGVASWKLGLEDPSIWNIIVKYVN